ncbi:hypothetical protein AQAU111925_02385 [Aquirufa aurantiipilula]
MKSLKSKPLRSNKSMKVIITENQLERLLDSYISILEESRYTKMYSIKKV